MKPLIVGLAGAVLLLVGFSQIQAGILFDNGSASGPDDGVLNSEPFAVFDDFTLSSDSIIDGVTWTQHDRTATGYTGTDISIFNAFPSPASQVFTSTYVASRTPNASGLVFGNSGFDYSVSGLALNLAAGTYFIGTHTTFNNGSWSSWDQTTGSGSSITGRYQMVPLNNVRPGTNPPLFDANHALFYFDNDSAFQILGTSKTDLSSDPTADPAPVPEPASLLVMAILLGSFVTRQVDRRRARIQTK